MNRLPDWQARLAALVAHAHIRPFAWGERDCCLWAADAVLAVTGNDPAIGIRGTYRTERAAYLILAAHGGLRGLGDRIGPRIRPAFAIAGDVGIVRATEKPMAGVCIGDVWMVSASSGLRAFPLGAVRMAWGVGHA
jgi:hypothetical protein